MPNTTHSPEGTLADYTDAQARYDAAIEATRTAQVEFKAAREALGQSRRAYYRATLPDDAALLTPDQIAGLLPEYMNSDMDPDDGWARLKSWTRKLCSQVDMAGYDHETGLPTFSLFLTRNQGTKDLQAGIEAIAAALPLYVGSMPLIGDTDAPTPLKRLIFDPLEQSLGSSGVYEIVATRDDTGAVTSAAVERVTHSHRETLLAGTLAEVLDYAAQHLYYEDPTTPED
jgi:hypothetical protein